MNGAKRKEERSSGSNPRDREEKIREEQIKAVLSKAAERKRANRVIDSFLSQFRGKSLVQILPVLVRRCSSRLVVGVALERIERRWKELSAEDQIFVSQVRASLGKQDS